MLGSTSLVMKVWLVPENYVIWLLPNNACSTHTETPEESSKNSKLKDVSRIAGRISSLKEDLNGFFVESQSKLLEGNAECSELNEMKALYEQQIDVFTKQVHPNSAPLLPFCSPLAQVFALDEISGDDEVRERRKHCMTDIQVPHSTADK